VSDNPSSAGNQQERSITVDWVVGFVDGEGCFSVSLVKQAGGVNRAGYRLGWQVDARFAVTQGAKSAEVLHSLSNFFGVGRVYRNRRHDNHREDLFRYDVGRLRDLNDVIVPFFELNQLRTAKRVDFKAFAQCVRLMTNCQHLHPEGLIAVLEFAQTMNHQKPRTDLIEILRGHTPNIPELVG
jgi:hypothetical protein